MNNAQRARYSYDNRTFLPDTCHVERADLKRIQRALPETSARTAGGKKLFAAHLPLMGGDQYLFLTEQITDAAVILRDRGGSWETFGGGRTKQVPRRGRLIAPKRLRDADWDALARHPEYRETFSVPPAERGRELAESIDGVRFTGGPDGTDILVIASDVGLGICIFLRSPRGTRLALNIPLDD